jgi:Xaa-Pro aminopeptidase
VTLTPDRVLFEGLRRAKSEAEISNIEKTQAAVEAACAHAVAILEESEVGGMTLSSGAASP